MMSKLLAIGLTAAGCCFSQQVDLSSLDKLEAKAKSVDRVNLDSSQLHDAMAFANGFTDGVPKDVLGKVDSVQVRDLEFAHAGEYSDKDLDQVRKQVAALPGCTKVIDSKEENEHSEIYFCSGDKLHGMAIIDAEPKELSVVIVRGIASLRDLSKLHGLAGAPRVQVPVAPVPPSPPPPPPQEKKDDNK